MKIKFKKNVQIFFRHQPYKYIVYTLQITYIKSRLSIINKLYSLSNLPHTRLLHSDQHRQLARARPVPTRRCGCDNLEKAIVPRDGKRRLATQLQNEPRSEREVRGG